MSDTFRGQAMNCVRCACGAEHITFEDFMALTLPMPRASIRITHANSLMQCLAEYTKFEEIQCEFLCDKCGKKDRCKKQTVIWRFPPVLVLHLKRFHFATWRKEKLDTLVQFPCELDLSDFKGKSSNYIVSFRAQNSEAPGVRLVRDNSPLGQSELRTLHSVMCQTTVETVTTCSTATGTTSTTAAYSTKPPSTSPPQAPTYCSI